MAKITLIGAGSAQFGYGTLGDIFSFPSLAGTEISLLDINAESLKSVQAEAVKFIEKNKLPFTVSATTDRKQALEKADFVIISIEVGNRFELWNMDWSVPQQFGIKQIYGENGGPGGLFHSLRIIPPILEICQDVLEICPRAYVFNYSNPMSRICTAVYRKFPDLRFFGLCHEIASLEKHLPGILGVPFSDLKTKAGGLNHFSVVLEAFYRKTGLNAYPDILANAPAYFKDCPCFSDLLEDSIRNNTLYQTEGFKDLVDLKAAGEWGERGVFKAILEKFDLLPITTDSHFGEYINWAYDVADHKAILDFYTYYQKMLSAEEHGIEMKPKERVAFIVNSLLNDERITEDAVNLPNRNLIRELPDFMAVETPVTIDKSGITGIPLGELPKPFAGLLSNQVAIHDMTAHAVLQKSKKTVVQALMVDPVVNIYNGLDDLVEVMISKQSKYLGYLE